MVGWRCRACGRLHLLQREWKPSVCMSCGNPDLEEASAASQPGSLNEHRKANG
jgi:uncharacterized OB-fold protein